MRLFLNGRTGILSDTHTSKEEEENNSEEKEEEENNNHVVCPLLYSCHMHKDLQVYLAISYNASLLDLTFTYINLE